MFVDRSRQILTMYTQVRDPNTTPTIFLKRKQAIDNFRKIREKQNHLYNPNHFEKMFRKFQRKSK